MYGIKHIYGTWIQMMSFGSDGYTKTKKTNKKRNKKHKKKKKKLELFYPCVTVIRIRSNVVNL